MGLDPKVVGRPTMRERMRIEVERELDISGGDVLCAAHVLQVGRASIYRWLNAWRRLDRVVMASRASEFGISQDEIAALFGDITQTELAKRWGKTRNAAHRRINDAAHTFGRRRVSWGLALLPDRPELW